MTAFAPIARFTAVAAPLLLDNVDTDQIIPSREMRSTGKTGLADGLFAGWRYTTGREPNPDFVLNRADYAGARVLLAGTNFGSGSSREHAVWALAEYGIRAVVAAGFAPIFHANCIRNGIVPAALGPAEVEEIAAHVAANPRANKVTVDVPAGSVTLGDGRGWSFPLADEARAMLVEGLDGIDLTLKHAAEIVAWRAADRTRRPWIYLGEAA